MLLKWTIYRNTFNQSRIILTRTGSYSHGSDRLTGNQKWTPIQRRNYYRMSSIANYISSSQPIQYTQHFITWIHDTTHLPWCGTIILVAMSVRLLVALPFDLYQQRNAKKQAEIKPELDQILKEINIDILYQVKNGEILSKSEADKEYRSRERLARKQILKKYGIKPLKGIVGTYIQLPFWLASTYSYRNITMLQPSPNPNNINAYNQFSNEGMLWFKDLTSPDTYFILPILLTTINLVNIQLSNSGQKELSKVQYFLKNFFQSISILVFIIAAYMPSGISFYWCTSSFLAFLQNQYLKRRTLKISKPFISKIFYY